MNDNRNYQYKLSSVTNREEYKIITNWVTGASRVIDLACGDGSLLLLLKSRGIDGIGIDVSKSGIASARKKGIKAIEGRIDVPLKFKKNEFDIAICNVTIQMVSYPEVLLSEMKRIANKQIVSFPNFAFFLNRLDLLIFGRMPRVMIPGFKWYSTGHIHQLSIADFTNLCYDLELKELKKHFFFPKPLTFVPTNMLSLFPNLTATSAIFLLEG